MAQIKIVILVFFYSRNVLCEPVATKREIAGSAFGLGHVLFAPPSPWTSLGVAAHQIPSASEIAAALAAAREASTSVTHAQRRVDAAKHDVLDRQRIAGHKEANAALAAQRSEAAAAVHRQTASDAAGAVVAAQHRLAEAKAAVAELQRIAAEKEAVAAAAIQKAALVAAAEIRRTEHAAAKAAAIHATHTGAALKHVSAAKDASLAATSVAVDASSEAFLGDNIYGPWNNAGKVVHTPLHWR